MNAGSSYGYYIVATQQLPNPYSVWILLCLEIRGSMSLFFTTRTGMKSERTRQTLFLNRLVRLSFPLKLTESGRKFRPLLRGYCVF